MLLFACSYDEPAGVGDESPPRPVNEAAVEPAPASVARAGRSLQIIPEQASSTTPLKLVAKGFDLSRAKVRWLKNGKPLAVGPELRMETGDFNVTRGDEVLAVADIDGAEVLSGAVIIGNSPPRMKSVKLMPVASSQSVRVDAVAEDPDRDTVTIGYEWTKNEEPAGDDVQIGVPLKRGDWFTVRVTPFDGEEYGSTVVIRREVKNFPPEFTGEIKRDFDGKLFTFEVKALDPDGDPLAYAVSGPEGAKIEPYAGAGSWEVPEDFEGRVSFTVTVADGHGGEARQTFKLTIAAGGQ